MIDISVREAIQKAKREFADLSQKQMARGVARAINHTLGVTKTASRREITGIYKIRAKDINQSFRIQRATARQLIQTGMLLSKGSRLPLIGFSARQTKRGVTVNVKNQRKLIRSAFIATMPSGHRGVFGRGNYSSGEFQLRKHRIRKNGNDLPITEMTSISVPKALSNDVVLRNLGRKIESHFPARLMHELMRIRTTTGDVPSDVPG